MEEFELDVSEVRRTHNELSITCEDPELVNLFMSLIMADANSESDVTIGQVVRFRNLVRRELGFGKEVDTNEAYSWIVDLQPVIRKSLRERQKG
jgi:hypothetical protein